MSFEFFDCKTHVLFYFVVEPEELASFFTIDEQSGAVTQVSPIDRVEHADVTLQIKAEETSDSARFQVARLVVSVTSRNEHAPELDSDAYVGSVRENSVIGTYVTREGGGALRVLVSDLDVRSGDPPPRYNFRLDGSNLFRIDSEGYITVNTQNLDFEETPQVQFRVSENISHMIDSFRG